MQVVLYMHEGSKSSNMRHSFTVHVLGLGTNCVFDSHSANPGTFALKNACLLVFPNTYLPFGNEKKNTCVTANALSQDFRWTMTTTYVQFWPCPYDHFTSQIYLPFNQRYLKKKWNLNPWIIYSGGLKPGHCIAHAIWHHHQ